jgi:energy-converting hydrogenase Eha subunit G
MKLSKLDPMTVLMLVVAFGVVITMLTQNSVASEGKTFATVSLHEKQASAGLKVATAHGVKKNTLRQVSY